MANQPGYKTLVSLEEDIILAIKNNVESFSGMLFQHNLIDSNQYDDARNTTIPVASSPGHTQFFNVQRRKTGGPGTRPHVR